MNRNILIVLGVVALVLVFALIAIRPFATSGNEPGRPSPHALDQ